MLLHLAWRHNLDGLDLALAVNRLAAHGTSVWWLGAAGPEHEPGDYLIDVGAAVETALAGFGLMARRWRDSLPDGAIALAAPRIALLAGTAAAYPNFAYYAMALARLGFDVELIDGAAIAAGWLGAVDIVVLPAGSAIWGLDAAEGVIGADARLRAFLDAGGAAVASSGGAFYLSAGRPGWTGTARARPHHAHEYLRTGVGIVSVRLLADSIAFGCPPTLDMPYYHGPVYDELDRSVSSAATFHRLVMPGRLFFDNPLDPEVFRRELAGHTAILRAEGRRGRAVLFSPDPEMGDLIRRYIAFDDYVAHYLPLHGEATMADTLRHYRPLESPSWRLVLNAIHSLMLRRRPVSLPSPSIAPRPDDGDPPDLAAATEAALGRLPEFDGRRRHLAEILRDDLAARLGGVRSRLAAAEAPLLSLAGPAPAIRALRTDCERAAVAAFVAKAAGERTGTERLAEIDTAVTLLEAWCRLAEAEAHFTGAR
ncbi:MAG TPA: hypothetical protein VND87_17445 [Stellaceae bacterium]|nr:hypothetical protein [Stellaceae bacterium]